MASTGNGYSTDNLPNYAGEYQQTQEGLAHKFDQYTNPFLLSKGLQDTFLPYIKSQNDSDYQRASLNLDQQRQDLAKTQQDTLLPLQAQAIGAQTDLTRAQGAEASFNLEQKQTAFNQMPDYFKDIADAQTNSDPSGVFTAASKNPAAALANPGVFNDSLNRIFQQQTVVNTGITGAAQATGGDYMSMNPGATLADAESNFKPTDGLTPAQQLSEKNAYLQGAAHTQTQIKAQEVQGAMRMAANEYKTNGFITAATIKQIGPLIKAGKLTPDVLASFAIDPETGNAIIAAANAAPDANGNIVPDKAALQRMNVARSLLNSKTVSTQQANWANETINTGGHPSFDLTVIPPAIQDKIDSLTEQKNNLQNSLGSRWTFSLAGKSDYDTTNQQITDLNNQINDLKNNYQSKAPASGQPTAPRPTFGQNRFLPNSGPDTTPYNPQASGPDETYSGTLVLPGNPLTTNALDATSGESSDTVPSGGLLPGMSITPAMIPSATKWVNDHPGDPRADDIKNKLIQLGVRFPKKSSPAGFNGIQLPQRQ